MVAGNKSDLLASSPKLFAQGVRDQLQLLSPQARPATSRCRRLHAMWFTRLTHPPTPLPFLHILILIINESKVQPPHHPKQLGSLPVVPVSALTGQGVSGLLPAVARAYRAWNTRVRWVQRCFCWV